MIKLTLDEIEQLDAIAKQNKTTIVDVVTCLVRTSLKQLQSMGLADFTRLRAECNE